MKKRIFTGRNHFREMAPRNIQSGLLPYSGPWGEEQARHLLRRTMFGAAQPHVDLLASMTMNDAVDMVLTPSGITPTPPINNYNHQMPDPDVPAGASIINAPQNNDLEIWRTVGLKSWWLNQMMSQTLSIEEKLIYFWHNHVPVQMYPVFNGAKNWRYLNTLRQYAFGNFKAMMKAITLDPAMLTYLNGQYNSVWAPDENYARELQELFCIGKGPNALFTEDDVQEAARVLTGWRILPDYTVVFDPLFHDSGTKQFSSFYNNTTITGFSGPGAGDAEIDALMDMIFANDEVAYFICRKLYRFFVYHEITAQTETDVIEPLATIFRNANYEIAPVLEALFKSEHFFDSLNYSAVLKSPLDFLVGLAREANMAFPDYDTVPQDFFDVSAGLIYYSTGLQQNFGDPPNVSGHPAWHQIPSFDKLWITTDSYPRRIQYTDAMVFYGYATTNFTFRIDTVELCASFPSPEDPFALIDDAIARFHGLDLSQSAKTQLLAVLLSGQTNPSYWTTAWLNYAAAPTDPSLRAIVETRLKNFFGFLFHYEEFQLI